MKHLTLIIAATLGFAPVSVAMDDNFGARFTDQTPAGFEDGTAADGTLGIEKIPPELIEPAAGDYFDSETQGVEEEAAQDAEDKPQEPGVGEKDAEISL